MNRRLLTILLPFAAASLAAGCATFSDNDAIARVNDVELTSEVLRDRLGALGTAEVQDSVPVRLEIVAWIQSELARMPEVRDAYANGVTSGSICPQVLVVETSEDAEAAAAELEGGADFLDVFAARNADPSLNADNGRLGCVPAAEIPFGTGNPFVDSLETLGAESPLATAAIPTQPGAPDVFAVTRFIPFDELGPTDTPIVVANLTIDVPLSDIYVDPRFGVYDTATGTIVALR